MDTLKFLLFMILTLYLQALINLYTKILQLQFKIIELLTNEDEAKNFYLNFRKEN